eukprot:TRINITY_DN1836_c0_g1_i7.p1 TRINITY_DN1836_c0_g1~~TRINITY_DN1836_c0_g1_i7.p1  ORF type:complete len:192 (+),score=23.77 TRINITY_DN1836_c0_g1_i7:191-766(+)
MLKEVIPEVSLGSEAEGHSKTARKDELQQLDDLWPDKRPAHMFKEMVPEVSLGSEAEGQAWRRPHSRAAWKREPSAASKWSLAKMQRLPKPTRIMSYGVTGWKTTQQQSSQRHPSRWFPRYSRGRGHLRHLDGFRVTAGAEGTFIPEGGRTLDRHLDGFRVTAGAEGTFIPEGGRTLITGTATFKGRSIKL